MSTPTTAPGHAVDGAGQRAAARRLGDAPSGAPVRVEAVVDTAAITANTRALLELMRAARSAAELMAVVKADGYGHGAEPAARAALRGGATWLGLATPGEALALRDAGLDAPMLAWLWVPGEDIAQAVAAGVDLGVSSAAHLDTVFAVPADHAPRIHVKIDTGLGRNGVGPRELSALLAAVGSAARAGRVEVVGLMSHLASADAPRDPSVAAQTAAFRAAVALAAEHGVTPRYRHLANTAAAIDHPDTRFDLVRCGIGIYGLNPVATPVALTPAMTLRATVALTKRVPAGSGVSYGLTYRTAAETTLALVPLGYADGIPRAASSTGEVWLAGRRRRIAGRVAMDQIVVDCGDDPVEIGDAVVVFGPGDRGEPTAREWADATSTIDYEIVTRIGPRVQRRHVDGRQTGQPSQSDGQRS